MKKLKLFLFLTFSIVLAAAFSSSATASENDTVAYRYTANGITVEAEHVDGETDLSTIVSLADADSTVYVLKDVEMAQGLTTESDLIDITKNLTIDLGGNTLTVKQNGKNYIRTASNVTATWQNGVIIAARMEKDGYAHPIFRFPSKTSPTLNLINITSYTGGLIGSYSGQSVNVNIEGGEHHLVLKSDLNINALLHARAGTKVNAKNASFYVGSYPLISATSNKTTNSDYTHSYTFENCEIVASSATKNLIGFANEYVSVAFNGCHIVGSISPTLHSWDSSKSFAEIQSGAITLGEDTALADGTTITENLAVCESGFSLIAADFDCDFTLNYSSGTLFDGDFAAASSTKTFYFTQQVGNDTGDSYDSTDAEPKVLIDDTTEWKYIDDNTDPANGFESLTTWTLPEFDDSAWKTGIGSFGAKSGTLGATNGLTPNVLLTHYITDTTTCIPAYFFRTKINIADASKITCIKISAYADDGVVIYLNGNSVLDTRNETPSTTTNLAYYTGVWDNTLVISTEQVREYLNDGENTIAVQLHNNQKASSDLYFEMTEFTVYYEESNPVPATQVVLGVGTDETERAVSWLSSSLLDGEVRLALAADVVGGVFPESYVNFAGSGTAATNKAPYTAFDAVMTGLAENTAYAYQIVMPNGKSDIYYFNTGSFGDYSFVFVGDPQIKTMSEGNEWSDTLDKILSNFDSELLISAGDQICTPSDETQYEYFIKNQLASIAFAPTVGPTHDNPSESYKDHFYTPNASASYGVTTSSSDYWFTYNNTLFININMADTSAATNGEHESFIKEAIAQNPDVTWKIVIMHVSLFSTGSHGNPDYAGYATEVGAYRAALAPVFTELGIDAVLSGHDHVYLRTNMMDGENISNDAALDSFTVNPYGTLYLCANSSTGSKFYKKTFEPTFAAAENYEERKSAIYFTVTDNSLTLTSYFLDDMSVFDTFTIYKGEEDESIDTSFGYSCSFENNISLNTYIPEEELGEYISVYLVIERETFVDGELTVVKEIIGDYTTYSGNFRFVYDEIAACEMGDKIYTTVYVIYDDGARASDTNEYSVKEYAYNRLARSSDESFKALLVDMLNYGAAAQLYFEYDVNNLVNAELTEEQRALARTDINAESIARVENSLDGASAFIIGRSVVFNSNVELKYYVQLSESVDVSNITLLLSYTTVNGVYKAVQISGSDFVYVEEYDAYGIKYTDIAAADMSCEISATVYSGDNAISDTTIYSIESYVANKLAESTDVLFKNLITEMYKYSESAEYYFTKQ